nr:MAG TPA: nucelotide kinase [Caudoviricetes sp.]
MEKQDNINPSHYRSRAVECIEFTERPNFCMGNAFKYVWRHREKNGAEDLKKAQWYLQRQLDSCAVMHLLESEEYADLMEMLEKCRLDDLMQHVLEEILYHAFFESEESLLAAMCGVSELLKEYGDERT